MLNIVCPGVILTPMISEARANPDVWAKIVKGAPRVVEDYAEAEDIAELMDFLLNCKTNHLVGQAIFFDSGSDAIRRPEW